MASQRGNWGSRTGFILAAAGSAVGLGNIWRFPYITGENGGGLFVMIYLACVALVGLPIMMAEIFIGRTAQNSPVGAIRSMSRPRSPWMGLGWLSVVAAFVILSFYSVVAGWSMHYVWLSVTNSFTGLSPEQIGDVFGSLYRNAGLNLFWHIVFMVLTIGIVIAGVKRGIEFWSRILLPALFVLLLVLLVYAMTTDGFAAGFKFVFGFHAEKFHLGKSTLAALGQAFFSLSLGMGALITYGSYMRRDEDVVSTSIIVCGLDTAVALLAALILFPILFTVGLDPDQSVGLAFVSLPIAFSQMPAGALLGPAFFILLTFAALTSAISLLEVATAYFIDERGWSRVKATLTTGGCILVLGIPSALSGGAGFFGERFKEMTAPVFGQNNGKTWFDVLDSFSSNWMLPLGGLGIAAFVAWRVGNDAREQGFKTGTTLGALYWGWVWLLRYLVPIAVVLVMLNALGVFDTDG